MSVAVPHEEKNCRNKKNRKFESTGGLSAVARSSSSIMTLNFSILLVGFNLVHFFHFLLTAIKSAAPSIFSSHILQFLLITSLDRIT